MNTTTEEQKGTFPNTQDEVEAHLAKASGIVRVISLGMLDNYDKSGKGFDETLVLDIKTALWSAYDHIDDARKLLNMDND
ncbi:MAG: hypothetical protein ACREV4_12890 [Gammaproteobacteria bacterium]